MSERAREDAHRAVRLVIEYDGSKLTVRDRQDVEMATPPSDPLQGYEGQSGFWFEVRDAKEKLLYRRVMSNPIPFDVEAHDPETGSRRYEVAKPRGVFAVLVPDLKEADSLSLMSSPSEPKKRAGPAKPLARFPLGRKRKGR